jgi:hypothetical protein
MRERSGRKALALTTAREANSPSSCPKPEVVLGQVVGWSDGPRIERPLDQGPSDRLTTKELRT